MAEVLVEYGERVSDDDGITYIARAVGAETPGGRWQGWIEFIPEDGGPAIRTGRETTQPNKADLVHWATGLTPVYLDGALGRALNPLTIQGRPATLQPIFDEPAPNVVLEPSVESILNPFSVYRKGESMLRSQLTALSGWHLLNIIRAYDLSDLESRELETMSDAELVELVVAGVRNRTHERAVK